MEVLFQKLKEKGITDEQRTKIYSYATKVSKSTLDEVCPFLLRIALESERGPLKNTLGQVIFHLQKNERINTLIGLQKLIDACLIVNPEEMFKVLETSDDDAKELAENIKSAL
jgi:hypothetical protein